MDKMLARTNMRKLPRIYEDGEANSSIYDSLWECQWAGEGEKKIGQDRPSCLGWGSALASGAWSVHAQLNCPITPVFV